MGSQATWVPARLALVQGLATCQVSGVGTRGKGQPSFNDLPLIHGVCWPQEYPKDALKLMQKKEREPDGFSRK